jgi:hypothetical protein
MRPAVGGLASARRLTKYDQGEAQIGSNRVVFAHVYRTRERFRLHCDKNPLSVG